MDAALLAELHHLAGDDLAEAKGGKWGKKTHKGFADTHKVKKKGKGASRPPKLAGAKKRKGRKPPPSPTPVERERRAAEPHTTHRTTTARRPGKRRHWLKRMLDPLGLVLREGATAPSLRPLVEFLREWMNRHEPRVPSGPTGPSPGQPVTSRLRVK